MPCVNNRLEENALETIEAMPAGAGQTVTQ
jgi:hypothetical protein